MVGFAIFIVFLFVFNCAYGFEMTLRSGETSSFLKSAQRAYAHYIPNDIEALSYKWHQPPVRSRQGRGG